MAYFNIKADQWDDVNSPVAGLSVSNLNQTKTVVSVSNSSTVQDFLKTLQQNGFLSCPVVADGELKGIVDVLDVLLVLVGKLGEGGFGDDAKVKDFFNLKVEDIYEISAAYKKSVNPCINLDASIDVDGKLPDLLNLMWGGWHRIPLTREGKIVSYVSQSDVLQFMVKHMGLILGDEILRKTVSELGFLCDIKTVNDSMNTYAVLCSINALQISAVPIVNEEGKLISQFSASDLRCLLPDNIADLKMDVLDFLSNHSFKNRQFVFPANIRGMIGYQTPHTVQAGDSFEKVMYKMAALRVHRLWVVDEAGKPAGIVSLGDLMRIFLFGK